MFTHCTLIRACSHARMGGGGGPADAAITI